MAARTMLNTILRDAAKTPLLRMTSVLMLDRREVIVVDAQPVVTRAADPQLTLDAMMAGGGDELSHGAEPRPGAGEGAADMDTTRLFRGSCEAIITGATLRRQVEQPVVGQAEANHLGHSVAAATPRAERKMRRHSYEFESIHPASA
jgi:hypothetical protein